MVGKRGRKPGVRNKFKQVLLINDRPDFLYSNRVYNITELIISGKKYNLGSISSDLHEHFKSIKGCIVNVYEKENSRTKTIEGFEGLHIRKAGENTTIEVSALTEEELALKIEELKNYLDKKGASVTQRCNWVCLIDKGKQEDVNNSELSEKSKEELKPVTKKTEELKPVTKKTEELKPVTKKTEESKPEKHRPTKEEKRKEIRHLAISMGLGNKKDIDYEKARKIKNHIKQSKRNV